MVVFTCSHCGDSLQKPKVSKHYETRCFKFPMLTCVDCLKDFKGNEYESHNRCLTEDQRYSAKGTSSVVTSMKGERKQEQWTQCVQNILEREDLANEERDLISALSQHPNLPRKKIKFINFINNAFRQFARNGGLVERVWHIFETELKTMAGQNQQQMNQKEDKKVVTENGSGEAKKSKKRPGSEENSEVFKKKKTKSEEIIEVDNNSEQINETDERSSFDWISSITKYVTEKSKNNQIPLEKVEKKILKKYAKYNGEEISEKIKKKFLKKLKKITNLSVSDGIVTIS